MNMQNVSRTRMLKSSDFLLGGYIPGISPIHRLDPRVKLVSFLLLVISVFISPDLRSLILSACATLLVAFMAHLGRRAWIAAFYRFSWLLILAFVLNLVFDHQSAQTTATGPAIPGTPAGVWKAISLTGQLSMGIALSVVLTATTMPTHLIKGMVALARPLKKIGAPVEEAATITYLALRFTPILQEEVRAIVEAQKSRGIDFHSCGIFRRAWAFSSVLAPALQGTIRRSDKLAAAMEARGYRPGALRMASLSSDVTTLDACALALSATLTLCAIFLKFT